MLWPEGATLPQAVRAALPVAIAAQGAEPAKPAPPVRYALQTGRPIVGRPIAGRPYPGAGVRAGMTTAPVAVNLDRMQLALLALVRFGTNDAQVPVIPRNGTLPSLPDREPGPSPTASLWAMARPGAASGGPIQLGGGQAGARIRVPIDPAGRIAMASRLASPLRGAGREIAFGMEWRPTDIPVALVVERRLSLDRTTNSSGVGVTAGADRSDALFGFDLEGYGQSGIVVRNGIEPYADGAARLTRRATMVGDATLRMGAGIWAGAQRDAARLDIGPSAMLIMPIGARAVRLAVDWRQRIAGNAAPGSGPAVTLGTDL